MRPPIIWILCAILLNTACSSSDEIAIKEMTNRLIPRQASNFIFEQIKTNNIDSYEIESIGSKIIIRGNNANSMAVGLNHYLKYYCLTTVSWYRNDMVEMPNILPTLKNKISSTARCKNRFFLNYCTFGYTMPWWKWQDWERLIDWMALNGINMPLAITGQESVWYKVWTKMGLSDKEVRNYFTGPAHLPWHRMSNLDYWQGGIPIEWLNKQETLQKQITARERSFNMKPVLPAFAGHVPVELKRLYPNAKISQMSSWGGFKDKYRSHFLDPLDPLFNKIQKAFLEEQTHLFGTNNIYGADPFNEVEPPNWEPQFLASSSKHIYESISAVDSKAIWLQMTWLFYIDRTKWTNERVKAFLHGVPQDKLLLLDYYCENTEVWKQTESYYGQPFLWCYLGNFGGNTMLSGNIKEVGERIENIYKNGGINFWGLGSTLEGFDVNPFIYEYIFEKAWNNTPNDTTWITQLADRHVGIIDQNARKAWRILYDSVYQYPAKLGQGTLTNARPTLIGNGNWTTNPLYKYSNQLLFTAEERLLKSKKTDRATYQYDIVNIMRQILGNYFMQLRDEFTAFYNKREIEGMKIKAIAMKDLLNDLNKVLSTQSSFLVGKWIEDARSWGINEKQKKYYEENARNLISTWGDKRQSLNDYANRSWAGLISGYYQPRWNKFLDDVIVAVEKGNEFDSETFYKEITEIEYNWVKSTEHYTTIPTDNAVEECNILYFKYKNAIMLNNK